MGTRQPRRLYCDLSRRQDRLREGTVRQRRAKHLRRMIGVCTDDMATAHLHQPDPQVLHDFEPRVVFDLEPVDSVTVTTLMDNVTDAFMPDQGPARRPPLPVFEGGRRPALTMASGDAPDGPLAHGGSSVLGEAATTGARHHTLF